MITVTDEQLKEFILKQPADRPLRLGNAYVNEQCGCVMVHYGLDNELPIFYETSLRKGWLTYEGEITVAMENPDTGMDVYTWWDRVLNMPAIYDLEEDIQSYGELQKYVL